MKKNHTAFVVFRGSEADQFWRWAMPRGWRHCYLLIPFWWPEPSLVAAQWTIKIEATGWGLAIDVLYARPREVVRYALHEGATAAVKFPLATPPNRFYILRGLITCVSVVKAVLGITGWWIVTPKRLHDWLIANGGERINHDG